MKFNLLGQTLFVSRAGFYHFGGIELPVTTLPIVGRVYSTDTEKEYLQEYLKKLEEERTAVKGRLDAMPKA
jgi:hypothetical protein